MLLRVWGLGLGIGIMYKAMTYAVYGSPFVFSHGRVHTHAYSGSTSSELDRQTAIVRIHMHMHIDSYIPP